MKSVQLHDKTFDEFIPAQEIQQAISRLAARINADYRERPKPLFLGVLNGSFMFMADLVKQIDFDCEISFVKLASYAGTRSTGRITELIGLTDNLRDRHIIVVEDIVDTGQSIEHLLRSLVGHQPASIEIATMLFKPEAYKKEIEVKYSAIDIPNDFIVGYGLDYDQLGRNLPDIYKISE